MPPKKRTRTKPTVRTAAETVKLDKRRVPLVATDDPPIFAAVVRDLGYRPAIHEVQR